MGITIPAARLSAVLERAVRLAESDAVLSPEWTGRAQRIAESPYGTYTAALGTALLAKAADAQIDALTIKSSAGETAYSMRGVVRVLAGRASHYGYHLGVTSPEPLNNQPWFGSDRIDEISNVRRDAQEFLRDLIRFLTDLNALDEESALVALASFLRLRLRFEADRRARMAVLGPGRPQGLWSLVKVLEGFVRADSEGGRRAQALAAAVLEAAHSDVRLASINSPTGLDVTVHHDDRLVLGVEVKDKVVEEATLVHLADEAARRGGDKALLVALASQQGQLDLPRARRRAFDEHGVVVDAYVGIAELVLRVGTHVPASAHAYAFGLPDAYLRRMQEHGVSDAGQQHWVDLIAAQAAS